MKWSVSASKIFSQCPKKWYYGTVFASSKASNPERKEAHLLKHLQSVYSWRGKLVDQVITRFVIPRLNRHESVHSDEVLFYANRLMKEQLDFAKSQLSRTCSQDGTSVNSSNYCALFELEYYGALDDEIIQKASEEVRNSLINLLDSELFRQLAEDCLYLIAQRILQFRFARVTVMCTPDLIAFFRNKPPIIVDWKVETPKHKEHWLQLGVYGFALSRVTPHKDFPDEWLTKLDDPTRIGLIEFQLLRDQELHYFLTQEDLINIEDYIYMSSNRMLQMIDGAGKKPEFLIDFLPRANWPELCQRCKFRKICWKEQA